MTVLSDLRIAVRTLLRMPGFFALAALVLGLAVASVVVMYGVLRFTVLEDPPFEQSDRLVWIAAPLDDPRDSAVPLPDLLAWSRELTTFQGVAGVRAESAVVTWNGPAEHVESAATAGPLFQVLRQQPLLGRTFTAEDASPDAPAVVLISESLWRTRFGAAPGVLGRGIRIDGQPATVVGVLPASFDLPVGARLWIADRTPEAAPRHLAPRFLALGRLRDGVDREAALAELSAVPPGGPSTSHGASASPRELRPVSRLWLDRAYERIFRALFASVLLVLGLACANVAGLLLVRATGRTHEAAVRRALGATRARVAGQMMAESAVIGAAATLLALTLAAAAGELLRRILPLVDPFFPAWWRLRLDGEFLAWSVGAAFLSTIAAGAYPAVRASGASLDPLLRDGVRQTGFAAGRMVQLLVVVELALSAAVLTTAGVVIRAGYRMAHENLGAMTEGILFARVIIPKGKYDWVQQCRFLEKLDMKIQDIPGASEAGLANSMPGGFSAWREAYQVERGAGTAERLPPVEVVPVGPRFFETLRIPILAGRGIDPEDRFGRGGVVVVSDSLARTVWPGEPAVGKRIRLGLDWPDPAWWIVVGVAADVLHDGRVPSMGTAPPTVYPSLFQLHGPYAEVALRGRADPRELGPRFRRALAELDQDVAAWDVRLLDEERQQAAAGFMLVGWVFAAFGAVAVFLAGAGVYGVLARSVAQAEPEIALRRALGAPDRAIAGAVLARSGAQLAVGLAVSALVAPFMAGRIGQVLGGSGHPLVVYLSVAGLMLGTTAVAVALPLRRALRVPPWAGLRNG